MECRAILTPGNSLCLPRTWGQLLRQSPRLGEPWKFPGSTGIALPPQRPWISPWKLWQHRYCQGRHSNSQQTLKLSAFPLKGLSEVFAGSGGLSSLKGVISGSEVRHLFNETLPSSSQKHFNRIFCQSPVWFCWICFKIFYQKIPWIFIACSQ